MARRMVTLPILAVVLVGLSGQGTPPLHFIGPLPAKECTPSNFCESTIKLPDEQFADGQGNTATSLSHFVISIIQFYPADAPLITNWVANYDQYNVSEDAQQSWQSEYIIIRFKDGSGNYLSDAGGIVLDRSHCRNVGHSAQAGLLGDVFAKGAVTIEVNQQPLTDPIGPC